MAERLVLSPEKEAEGKVGIVLELEGNLGKLVWVEAIGVYSLELAPTGL